MIIAAGSAERMRIDSSGNTSFGGRVAVGTTPNSSTNLYVTGTITGATYAANIIAGGTIASDATVARMFQAAPYVAASAAITSVYNYFSGGAGLGASASVTNNYGFYADSGITTATNNYGFYGNIASGTNRYNLYMAGTAANYLAGTLTAIGGISGGTF